jgi:hypothetical protein
MADKAERVADAVEELCVLRLQREGASCGNCFAPALCAYLPRPRRHVCVDWCAYADRGQDDE